jgi:regulator of sirC expression with transglutaminase-like and TPR domain
MVMKSSPAQRLKEIVGRPEEKLDLAEAALLIAQDEYPELDVSTYLHRLDELAETVRTRLLPDAGPESIISFSESRDFLVMMPTTMILGTTF